MRVHGGDTLGYSDIVLDFSINVNPLGMPQAVKEAAKKAVDFCGEYPDFRCRELKKAISEHYEIPENQILCGNGASDLIFRLVQAIKPKKALLPCPTFSEYETALRGAGCEIIFLPLLRENDFLPDDSLLEALDCGADLLFFCNPNNPTGQYVDRHFIKRLAEACREKRITLCLDECFAEFLEEYDLVSALPLIPDFPNLFILRAFTKTYAMAGLRLGWAACADQGLICGAEAAGACWNVSIPAQKAGIAAMKETEFLRESKKLIAGERRWMKQELETLGFEVSGSHANYLFFRSSSARLKEEMALRHILIRDCRDYHGLDEYDYRVAVKTHPENIQLMDALIQCK